MADKIDDKAKRVRSLLSSYYGTSGQDGSAGGGSISERASGQGGRVASIDSAAFDSKQFLNALVKGTRLDGLQSKYTEMVQEIKSLDSDMQMLVYENYSKFITATDTIRSMKRNVEGMGEKMERLLGTMNGIATKSDEVNETLAARRASIEELNGVRALLRKLQVVFELPNKLRVCLEQDALALAVNYYTGALPILQKYGSTSLGSIAKEVDVKVAEVQSRLRERVRVSNVRDNAQDVQEYIQLLTQLGEDPEQIQMEYLTGSKAELLAGLKRAQVQEGGVLEINSEFISGFTQLCHSYTAVFPSGHTTLDSTTRELFQQYFQVVVSRLQSGEETRGQEEVNHGWKDHEEEQGEYEGRDQTTSHVSPPLLPSRDLVATLQRMSSAVGRVSQLVPGARLPDRCQEVVEKAVRQYLESAFTRIQSNFQETLEGVRTQCNDSSAAENVTEVCEGGNGVLRGHLVQLSEGLLRAVEALLSDLQEVTEMDLPGGLGLFSDLVQGRLSDMFHCLHSRLCSLGGVEAASPEAIAPASPGGESSGGPGGGGSHRGGGGGGGFRKPTQQHDAGNEPAFTLLLSCLCSFMESHMIPSVMEKLAMAFGGALSGAGGSPRERPPFVAQEVARLLRFSSERLLEAYVHTQGCRLACMVRSSFATTTWQKLKEPRDVRRLTSTLVKELEGVLSEVSQVLDASGDPPSASASSQDLSALSGSSAPQDPPLLKSVNAGPDVLGFEGPGHGIDQSVALLFQQHRTPTGSSSVAGEGLTRETSWSGVDPTRRGVTTAVTKAVLRALVENLRLHTLGRAGFQQIQLDVHFMRSALAPLVNQSVVIATLLDDVEQAASDRSEDPIPMDRVVIDRILTNAKRRNKSS